MIFKNLLAAEQSTIRGFLPVYKPIGVPCAKIRESVLNDLYFAGKRLGFGAKSCYQVNHPKYLEPFASGILTLVIGNDNLKLRNFVHSSYVHRTKYELGIKRKYDNFMGDIVDRASIDHIKIELIEEAVKQFEGAEMICPTEITQYSSQCLDLLNLSESQRRVAEMYWSMTPQNPLVRPPKEPQKYNFTRPARSYKCNRMQIVSYCKPFLTVDVHTNGGFVFINHANSLGRKLDTICSLVELTRLQEGPMTLDDLNIFQLHETSLEYYYHRMRSIRGLYTCHLNQYDEVFESPKQRRL